jgi:PAS domain S-box-containing protein
MRANDLCRVAPNHSCCTVTLNLAVAMKQCYIPPIMVESTAHASKLDNQIFRDVFNASPIGIAIETLEGQPLFVNPALCSMLGFSEKEMRNKHCVDFSPPEDAEKDWALFRQLRAGSINQYQLEKRYFRADGSLFWGRLTLSLLNNLSSPLVIARVEDITDKRAAEETQARQAAIVESSDDAIISKSVDGTILSWNPGAQQIYGYTAAEVVGKPISIIVPSELRNEQISIHQRLRDGERIEHFETVRVTKSGKKINVSMRLWPVKDASGVIVGSCAIARDITERKVAERTLEDLTRKLIQAQEQERARIGRELHDDINQRLSMLAMELEEVQDHPAEIETRIQQLRRQIAEISNDLQALSHELHASKLEYLGVVAGMKGWCRELGERQKVQIGFSQNVSTALPLEIGLPLFRVLQEAVHNSIKHSGTRRIEVQLQEESGVIQLIVSDSGKGFDVDAAMRGQGLGLTSMRERVSLVNGSMTIESKPMNGTRIHVRVPFPAEHLFPS